VAAEVEARAGARASEAVPCVLLAMHALCAPPVGDDMPPVATWFLAVMLDFSCMSVHASA